MKVGFSSVNITPPPGFPLGGYLERYLGENKALGKLNDLFATAIYIDEGEGLLLISTEVIAVEDDLYNYVKKYANSRGIKHIVVSATHTHSAPESMYKFPFFRMFIKRYQEKVLEYLSFLKDKLKEAIDKSMDNMKNYRVDLIQNEVKDICACRNDPNKKFNNQVIALKFGNNIFLKYSCHPTVLSAKNMYYSGDFFSFTRDLLAQKFVNIAIFNGAAGDLSTRFTRKEQTVEEAKRLGFELGRYLLKTGHKKTLGNEIEIFEIKLRAKRREIDFESFQNLLEIKVMEGKKMLNTAVDKGLKRKIENELMMGTFILNNLKHFREALLSMPIWIDIPVTIIKFREIGFITLPFEVYSDFETDHNNMGYQIIGYSNGYLGYAPTADVFKEMDYEAMAAIIAPGEIERIIVEIKQNL